MRALPAFVLSLCCLAACSTPPQKELDLAQGALDAARAAGAEQYAPQQMASASGALQQAHQAVSERDYRLALTRALDAHDRALEAAKAAADGRALARGDVDAEVAAARVSINALARKLASPDVMRLPKRDLDAARRVLDAARTSVQEASETVTRGDYDAARAALTGVSGKITAEIARLDEAAAKKPARPVRRGR